MTCSEFDWKGFALDESATPERRLMEEHLATCSACAAELDSIRLTVTALKRLPVREIPRRISFVSDPVFEPSWWQRVWNSAPKLGFASAAMLSLAIVAHGVVTRPAQPVVSPAPMVQARQVSSDEVRAQVAAELKPVMAEFSARLAEYEKKSEQRRQADLADVKNAFDTMHKRVSNIYLSAARFGGD